MTKNQEISFDELEELFVKRGKLYINPKYKKMYPGHRFILPTDKPGQIESYKAAGYEIVYDTEEFADAGASKPSTSSSKGSMVTIQSGCGATHVLMHAPEEVAQKLDKLIEYLNKKQTKSLGISDGINPQHSYGKINIKNEVK